MTRYEAWPICGALLALALAVLLRRGACRRDGRVARRAGSPSYPAVAIVLFLLNSRWTVGAWFVSSGFFVAENEALGHPLLAWDQVREGVYRLSGSALVWPAYAGRGARSPCAFARSRVARVAGARPGAGRRRGAARGTRICRAIRSASATACRSSSRARRSSAPGSACCRGALRAVSPRSRRRRRAAGRSSPLDRAAPIIAESQRDAAEHAPDAAP